jgi:hypothetical protein
MAEGPPDVNLAQWGLGAATTALGAALTWLWNRMSGMESRLDARISAATAAAKSDDRDLWAAITEDRRSATAYRERTLERLAEMPTKSDLAAMETRIAATLARQPPHA